MNNKKKLIIITSIIIIAIISSIFIIKNLQKKEDIPDEKKEVIKENIHPLMYEITKEGSNNKIYLFGSIHLADTNKLNFPEYIINAYNNSDYIACEFDIVEYQNNQEEALKMIQEMIYTDETTIKDHLEKNTYDKLVNFLKDRGMYSEIYDVYKPMFFQSLITTIMSNDTKLKANDGIDLYFLNKAKKDQKKILEIESSDYQTKLLSNLPDKLYDLMISDLIDNYDEEVNSLKELYNAWKTGNIEKIIEESNEELDIKSNYTQEEINIIKDYNKKLIDDRNITMTKKLEEYFNNNYHTFYMVGAAHLVSDKGIAHLLKEKGYIVKQIST